MVGNGILKDKNNLRRWSTNCECRKKKRLSKKIHGNDDAVTRITHPILVCAFRKAWIWKANKTKQKTVEKKKRMILCMEES